MRTHQLPILEPCHESWDAMDPDARGRFCQRCSKPVHDISAMHEADAHEFIRAHAGTQVCVRYRRDPEGRIRFHGARAAVAAVALAACAPHGSPQRIHADDPPPVRSSPVVVIPQRTASTPEPATKDEVQRRPAPPQPEIEPVSAAPKQPCEKPPRRERIVVDDDVLGLAGL